MAIRATWSGCVGVIILLDLRRNVDLAEVDRALATVQDVSGIIALTPLSVYFCHSGCRNYMTFGDVTEKSKMRRMFLEYYERFKTLLFSEEKKGIGKFATYLLAADICHACYLKVLYDYINKLKKCSYRIIYITDLKKIGHENEYIDLELNNNESELLKYIENGDIIHIKRKACDLDFKNKIYKIKNIFSKFPVNFRKIYIRLLGYNLNYDWIYYEKFHRMFEKIVLDDREIDIKYIENHNIFDELSPFGDRLQYKFKNLYKKILNFKNTSRYKKKYFYTWINDLEGYIGSSYALRYGISFFYQHGCYIYRNIFTDVCEIENANTNFVVNLDTFDFFKKIGSKNVCLLGSKYFNQNYNWNVKNKYDYVYFTQGHEYMGHLFYQNFENAEYDYDGAGMFLRHLAVVDFFGTKRKDLRLCVKIHPITQSAGVYVPLVEAIAKGGFTNVTVDHHSSTRTLLQESRAVIADYFLTDFMQTELHRKRNVAVFDALPTPLPEGVKEGIRRLVLVCGGVEELIEIVDDGRLLGPVLDRPSADLERYCSATMNDVERHGALMRDGFFGRFFK